MFSDLQEKVLSYYKEKKRKILVMEKNIFLCGHGINAYLQNKCHGFMDKRTYKDVNLKKTKITATSKNKQEVL